MRWIKTGVIHALLALCTIFDSIPRYESGRWWSHGDWGCYPFKLAAFASKLEDRWDTGAFGRPESAEHRSLYE